MSTTGALATAALPASSSLSRSHPNLKFTSRQLNFKPFGLRNTSSLSRVPVVAAIHKVKLISPEGKETEFEASEDTYLLDAAEEAGLELPYSCRAGACSTCAGLMVSGTVNQNDGSFLDDHQKDKGYVLTCISHPTSDCVIYTHKEADLY